MCTSVLLVGKSKEEVNAPQFMDFAAADLLDYAISSSQSHFRLVLGEDTDPKAICQWSVSTSPGLNPLDASADSGSDIDSSDEFNKDGDLRTPIAPPVTSLRMAKVIFLAGGEARDMGFSTGNVVVQMKMELLEDMFSLEEHLLGIWKMLNLIQNFSAIYFAFMNLKVIVMNFSRTILNSSLDECNDNLVFENYVDNTVDNEEDTMNNAEKGHESDKSSGYARSNEERMVGNLTDNAQEYYPTFY
ncbi:hypothetical protein AgCh_039328 [Apium graveolens]